MALIVESVASPIGEILLVADGSALCALEFADCRDRMEVSLRRAYPNETSQPGHVPAGITQRIASYFAGDVAALGAIDVVMKGTPFQRRVWTALRQVPPGTTTSYRDLAARIGAPRAIRAVGAANGANPISLVVPCHRVVGANGALTGYGGGLARKAWLIRFEADALHHHAPSAPVPGTTRVSPLE